MVPSIRIYNPEQVSQVWDEESIPLEGQKTEHVLWTAQPSELRFIWLYIICVLTFWLILPLVALLCIHIHNSTIKYILTTERLRICSGFFIRKIVDLELYRVKDVSIILPFHLRIFRLGNLELRTSDPTTPYFVLEAIPGIGRLEEMIRRFVEQRRDLKRVQEIDQYRFQ